VVVRVGVMVAADVGVSVVVRVGVMVAVDVGARVAVRVGVTVAVDVGVAVRGVVVICGSKKISAFAGRGIASATKFSGAPRAELTTPDLSGRNSAMRKPMMAVAARTDSRRRDPGLLLVAWLPPGGREQRPIPNPRRQGYTLIP